MNNLFCPFQERLAGLGLDQKRAAAMHAKRLYDADVGRLEPLQAAELEAEQQAAVVDEKVQAKVPIQGLQAGI